MLSSTHGVNVSIFIFHENGLTLDNSHAYWRDFFFLQKVGNIANKNDLFCNPDVCLTDLYPHLVNNS